VAVPTELLRGHPSERTDDGKSQGLTAAAMRCMVITSNRHHLAGGLWRTTRLKKIRLVEYGGDAP
jgi:hypothetical protein